MDPSDPSVRSQLDPARFNGLPQALITTRMTAGLSASSVKLSKRSILRSSVIADALPGRIFLRILCNSLA